MDNKSKITIIVIGIIFILILIGARFIINNQNDNNGEKQPKAETESVVKKINESNFKEKVLENNKKVVVDFYADWCGPCRILSPIVAEVAKEREDVEFVKINVDTSPNLPEEYGIINIPTLLVFENGEVINKVVGAVSKDDIIKLIE